MLASQHSSTHTHTRRVTAVSSSLPTAHQDRPTDQSHTQRKLRKLFRAPRKSTTRSEIARPNLVDYLIFLCMGSKLRNFPMSTALTLAQRTQRCIPKRRRRRRPKTIRLPKKITAACVYACAHTCATTGARILYIPSRRTLYRLYRTVRCC